MSIKSLWLLCLTVVCSAWGQTASDLASKYSAVTAYEVRPGILMTARYAQDGQVCEMTLEKRHQTPGKVDLDSTIPHELVKELVEELVPVSERGKPANQFTKKWGYITSIFGSLAVSEAQFENVSIEIDGSVSGSSSTGDEVVSSAGRRGPVLFRSRQQRSLRSRSNRLHC